jgi:hypothetical protein
MKDLRGTYVHYGDVLRRRRRGRAAVMVAGLVAAAVLGARSWEPMEAVAAGSVETIGDRIGMGEVRSAGLEGKHLERWHSIYNYSRRYKITTELSAAIYDAAVAERIDPALAFPLVRLESRFNEKAIVRLAPSAYAAHGADGRYILGVTRRPVRSGPQSDDRIPAPSRPHQDLQGRRTVGAACLQPWWRCSRARP